jgi:hypothetical protein
MLLARVLCYRSMNALDSDRGLEDADFEDALANRDTL